MPRMPAALAVLAFAAHPATAKEKQPEVIEAEFDASAAPKKGTHPGALIHGLHFFDANGETWVRFYIAESEHRQKGASKRLRVSVVRKRKTVQVVRTVRDQVVNCPLDLMLQVEKSSIKVTDLDKDGIAEVTFAYALTCTGDVSPATFKLLLLEGNKKYILRGSTQVRTGDGHQGGDFTPAPKQAAWPPAFYSYAKALWPTVRAPHDIM